MLVVSSEALKISMFAPPIIYKNKTSNGEEFK
jgi:hypothetical protein